MRPVLGFFAILSCASLALAAEAEEISADCGNLNYDKNTTVGVAAVNGAHQRVHFSKNASDEKSCPSMNAGCEEKAYLLPGDLVVAGRVFNGFVCASYVGTKGKEKIGWLPATSLDYRAPLAKPKAGDWIGHWKGLGDTPHFVNPGDQRADIVIERGEHGFLTLEGAMWYVIRPNDAPRSGVLGSDRLKPGPATLAFVGSDDNKSFDQAEEDGECAARISRVDRLLLVEDDGYCGGMGISFTGLYHR